MKYAIAILCSLLLIALMLEAGLRLTGIYATAEEREPGRHLPSYEREWPSWYWRQTPHRVYNNQQPEFTYEHRYNSHGFRESEFAQIAEDDSGKNKVLVFGDSFIEGFGAPADSSFPVLLGQHLNRDTSVFRVVNLGLGGSDVFFNYMDLVRLVDVLHPSHVIMAMNSTDIDDFRYTGGFERFLEDGTTRFRDTPRRHRIYRRFHLARWYYETVLKRDYTLMSRKEADQAVQSAIRSIESCIDSAYLHCRERSVNFLWLTYAVYPEICRANLNSLLIERIGQKERPYPYLSMVDEFLPMAESPECHTLGYDMDGHFNSRGYLLMAELFYDAVNHAFPRFWDAGAPGAVKDLADIEHKEEK